MLDEKSWIKKANFDRARQMARDAVRCRRALGMKAEHAAEDAAGGLGVSPRWFRSLILEEPVSLRGKYDDFLARWWSDMDRQAAALEERAAEIRRTVENDRVAEAQLELELGPPCGERSKPNYALSRLGFASPPGGSRSAHA